MTLRALLVIGGLGLTAFTSAEAKDKRPKPETSHANVKRAMKKAKKVRPTANKHKASKKAPKPPAAKRDVKQV